MQLLTRGTGVVMRDQMTADELRETARHHGLESAAAGAGGGGEVELQALRGTLKDHYRTMAAAEAVGPLAETADEAVVPGSTDVETSDPEPEPEPESELRPVPPPARDGEGGNQSVSAVVRSRTLVESVARKGKSRSVRLG